MTVDALKPGSLFTLLRRLPLSDLATWRPLPVPRRCHCRWQLLQHMPAVPSPTHRPWLAWLHPCRYTKTDRFQQYKDDLTDLNHQLRNSPDVCKAIDYYPTFGEEGDGSKVRQQLPNQLVMMSSWHFVICRKW